MGLSIKNAETERLVRELARRDGVGVTTAIRLAVTDRLKHKAQIIPKDDFEERWQRICEIQDRIAKLEVINPDVNDDDWMYDENGLPH
jgi:antitoxin VapB